MSNNIRVRRRHDGQSITGSVAFLAPQGLMVRHDPTDLTKLIKADAVPGFALTRDVVSEADLTADILLNTNFPDGAPPYPPTRINDHASASRVLEIEVEGVDLVQESGTGAISDATAVDTELGLSAGRWRVKQGGDAVAGVLRNQLDPIDPDNTCRILIDTIQ
jgi:hypothetical protein